MNSNMNNYYQKSAEYKKRKQKMYNTIVFTSFRNTVTQNYQKTIWKNTQQQSIQLKNQNHC